MSEIVNLSRRDFLKSGLTLGGGLILGFHLPSFGRAATTSTGSALNAFIRIGTDDSVTIIVNKSEMGQGVYTALPMIVAEELDADWKRVRFEAAPVDPAYNHTQWGIQATGGSTSVRSSWEQLRKAGATARAMLVAAAAESWKVEAKSCRTGGGFVIHRSSGRRLSYGKLASRAARLTPPAAVALKNLKGFRLVGKPTRRLDTPDKSNGKALFGIDVRLPGMLTAVVARPPVFGGKAKSFNAAKAKAVAGVRHVVEIERGIAVVADGFWPAKLGRDALEIDWEEGPLADFDSQRQREQYAELARRPGSAARKEGDVAAAMDRAAKRIEAVYELPYLAHATMEPLNCVADVRQDSCEIWTGTQFQTVDRNAAATAAGLQPEQVRLHTMFLGGGFGRRAVPNSHFVREAAEISKAVKAPVKVIWTREDDIRGGYYRPMWHNRIAAGLDAHGSPIAWSHTIVGQSILAETSFARENVIDLSSVEGAADLPYAIPNLSVELHSPKINIPVLWWRSVGHSHTAFAVESFLDELAHAGGREPYELRRALLANQPRQRAVLELAAQKAQWGRPLPRGRGRGIALHASFGSIVAQVAEVSVSQEGKVRVHRVVCAIDCGPIVNPDTIKAQMESGIVFGLSAALYGEITFEKGRVKQSNFHDYPLLRIHEMPRVEVHIVPSTESQGGVGEPGVPPIAPAVANAIFAATGKRIRRLPIRAEELKKG